MPSVVQPENMTTIMFYTYALSLGRSDAMIYQQPIIHISHLNRVRHVLGTVGAAGVTADWRGV